MKKILSLFAVFALVIVMGAGCEEKKPVDISEPVVTLNADELVRLGARTQDTGFQKKDVSGVLTTQLDDAVADVDLQGADLSNVGSATFTSTTITNLTFTTGKQDVVNLGNNVSVANAPIQLAQLPGTDGVKTFAYKFTVSPGNSVTLIDISDAELPQTNTYSQMIVEWEIEQRSLTYGSSYYSTKRREYADIRVVAGNALAYRVMDISLGGVASVDAGDSGSLTYSRNGSGNNYYQLNVLNNTTATTSGFAYITLQYNNF
jgi:hypothetical protein